MLITTKFEKKQQSNLVVKLKKLLLVLYWNSADGKLSSNLAPALTAE